MNRSLHHLEHTISRAIAHIRNQQQADGSFAHLSSILPGDFSGAISRTTTFFTSNILLCLQRAGRCPGDISKHALNFIACERGPQWTFNYWLRKSDEARRVPYPDDLDDTFAALAAIMLSDASLLDGRAFAEIVSLLTALETATGGPYRTWLTPKDAGPAWCDTDIVVNSTVGYFLLLRNIYLPKLDNFITESFMRGALASPYYPGLLHVAYFVARYYGARLRTPDPAVSATAEKFLCFLKKILATSQTEYQPFTLLERAMAVCALYTLEPPLPDPDIRRMADSYIGEILNSIARDGFLPFPFCIDPERNAQRTYAGASALTAAFCVEALAAHMNAIEHKHTPDTSAADQRKHIHAHIQSLAQAACADIGSDLCKPALAQITKTRDTRITSLPYEFASLLRKKSCSFPTAS